MLASLLQHRKSIWVISACVFVSAAIGLTRIGITPDNRVFYGPDDQRFRELRAFEGQFRSNTRVAFIITCQEPIHRCPSLALATQEMTKLARELPGVVHVDSLATYPLIDSSADSISSASYLTSICKDGLCDERKIGALREQHLVGRFISNDLRSLSVFASLDFDVGSENDVDRIYDEAMTALSTVRAEGLHIRFVGTVPMMQAFVDATNQELTSTLGLAFIAMAVFLYAALGSAVLCFTAIGLGAVTTLITLGVAGWFNVVLNTATATIPLVLFTLITATAMHMFMSVVRSLCNGTQLGVYDAVSASLSSHFKPILLTSTTTVLCLLSLVSVSSPPVQEIGIWSAFGLAVGTVLLLVLVPTILSELSISPRAAWHNLIQRLLNNYARQIERRRTISVVLMVATAAAGLSILQLEVDDDFVRYFDADNQFRKDTEHAARMMFGPNNVEVVVATGMRDGVYDPKHVEFVDRLTKRVREHPSVTNAYSIVDVLETTNRHFGDGKNLSDLDRESIAQLFLGYELSLDYGQSTFDIVNFDRSSSRISILADDVSARQIRGLEQSIYRAASKIDGEMKIQVTGESLPISHLSTRNIMAVSLSIVTTFLFTSIVLGFLFRESRIALVAFVSTVIPVICGFGVWGLFHSTVGLSTTVIIAVCMGVVIDDSIHLIYRYLDALKNLKLDAREAAAYAVHRVGSAIVTTTAVLTLGFALLLTSDFQLNSTFGGCSAVILVCALAFDLLILPEMLVWSAGNRPLPKPT